MLEQSEHENTCPISEEVDFLTHKILDLNKLLIESEQAKTRFLSLVANELNNPITAILGILPKFAPPEGDEKKELFDLLQEETLILSFRIQNLVAAAEIESGVIDISSALIHPYELVDEAMVALRFPINHKRINVNVFNRLSYPVVSDPLKLYLIILNVLANAVCYGNMDGKIDIKIEEDTSSLFISVTDEGRGPDVEFKPQVFTRFAHGPTGGQGLGIGLSIVRGLCERMDGTIDYSVDEGTVTFTVQLPLITQLPDSEASGSNAFLFDSLDDAVEL
jgi:signal transduction histidine kinase